MSKDSEKNPLQSSETLSSAESCEKMPDTEPDESLRKCQVKSGAVTIKNAIPASVLSALILAFAGICPVMGAGNVCQIEKGAVVGLGLPKRDITVCVIPDGVKQIQKGAFSGCTNLTSLTIPESMEEIKEGTFADCKKLQMVVIPGSCTISPDAFPASCAVLYPQTKKYWDAAQKGDAEAQFLLAEALCNGKGALKNVDEGKKWYRKSADQQYLVALGACYMLGIGKEKNPEKAFECFRKSADQGDAWGQNNLGVCYFIGIGVDKNLTEAVKWYRKAAEQGHADAQNNLGNCYYYGHGVDKNLAEAVKWYRKSAEQGNENAKRALKRLGF